jgi:hypothetical protein
MGRGEVVERVRSPPVGWVGLVREGIGLVLAGICAAAVLVGVVDVDQRR